MTVLNIRSTVTALSVGVTLMAAPLAASETVTVDNYARAESDRTFQAYVDIGGFGKFVHFPDVTPIDKQDVIRMNRDTLYSIGVFDLTTPVTITKPDTNGRFQSLQIVNQDHSMLPSENGPGEFTYTQEQIGTRYLFLLFRTFLDPNDPEDIKAAHAAQDAIIVTQEDAGSFKVQDWDLDSMAMIRDAGNVLAATAADSSGFFGDRSKMSPLDHLMGTASGWGGNPKEAAMYFFMTPEKNDGTTPHSVTAKDVPVDGFWSITMYNKDGFMEANDAEAYSFNNVTSKRNDDDSITINFGGCDDGRVNCLPITEGWNTIVRLYVPGPEILDGSWTFPAYEVVK